MAGRAYKCKEITLFAHWS